MTLGWCLSSDPRIELSIPRLKLEDPFQNSRDSLSAISLAPYSRHYLKFSQEASFQLSPARGVAVRSLISLLLLLLLLVSPMLYSYNFTLNLSGLEVADWEGNSREPICATFYISS